jgi:hypothetical protein
MTRAPMIFGAILMLVGAVLYFVDMEDGTGRNVHLFVVPSIVLMGLGALFAFFGTAKSAR